MSLEKRDLQRRLGLRQQQDPTYQCEHHHSMWWDVDYTLYTGDRSINSAVNVQIGRTLPLNPISLMYAVKAELFMDYTFAGVPDSFTLILSDCSGNTSLVVRPPAPVAYEFYTWDISRFVETCLKELCSVGLKSYILVSNVASAVIIHSLNLRFTMYKSDSFGGYNKPTDPFLILDTKTSKDYIYLKAKESKSFHYLSGLEMS